jgi:hypothetical protein
MGTPTTSIVDIGCPNVSDRRLTRHASAERDGHRTV